MLQLSFRRCYTNIRSWQISNDPFVQSISECMPVWCGQKISVSWNVMQRRRFWLLQNCFIFSSKKLLEPPVRLLHKHSHLAISPASQTFALGNARCFANIRTWQSSSGPLAQSLCEAGRASRRTTPVDLRKSRNSVIAACDVCCFTTIHINGDLESNRGQ